MRGSWAPLVGETLRVDVQPLKMFFFFFFFLSATLDVLDLAAFLSSRRVGFSFNWTLFNPRMNKHL